MNYFKILKLKEEELELLKEKLKEISGKTRDSQDYMLNMFDIYQKEQEYLEDLNKYSLEEYQKSSIKGLVFLVFLISIGSLLLIFRFIPSLLIYGVISLFLVNALSLFGGLKGQEYLTKKYQMYRANMELEIYEQKELIDNIGMKRDSANKEYHKLLAKKMDLEKEINVKSLEYEKLRKVILEAFYPFLISLEEENLDNNIEYQEALKKVKKLNIK